MMGVITWEGAQSGTELSNYAGNLFDRRAVKKAGKSSEVSDDFDLKSLKYTGQWVVHSGSTANERASFAIYKTMKDWVAFGGSFEMPHVLLIPASGTAIETETAMVEMAVEKMHVLDAAGQHRIAAREAMSYLEDAFETNDLAKVNKFLEHAKISRMSSRSLIGTVRSTFRARHLLPAWASFYRRAWMQFSSLEISAEEAFIGMTPPDDVKFSASTH